MFNLQLYNHDEANIENTLVETWMYERMLGKNKNRKDKSISSFLYKNDGLKNGLLK